MHILRTSSMLVRLVLAWFVLTMGAASASPVVVPATLALVCSDGGAKVVAVDVDGAVVHGARHTLDCPLCLPVVPPPSLAPLRSPQPAAGAAAPQPCIAAPRVATAGAPLPARGPPAYS